VRILEEGLSVKIFIIYGGIDMWRDESLEDIERQFGSVVEYNRQMEEEGYNDTDCFSECGFITDREYCEENCMMIDEEMVEYHCTEHKCNEYEVFNNENDQTYFCKYKECKFTNK